MSTKSKVQITPSSSTPSNTLGPNLLSYGQQSVHSGMKRRPGVTNWTKFIKALKNTCRWCIYIHDEETIKVHDILWQTPVRDTSSAIHSDRNRGRKRKATLRGRRVNYMFLPRQLRSEILRREYANPNTPPQGARLERETYNRNIIH